MQLERIAVAIRPRNAWEAIDLGFALSRQWWRQVYGPWFAVLLPLATTLGIVFWNRLWVASLILWWLKPFYDRIVLHVISRALFGDPPDTGQTLAAIPGLLKTGLLAGLSVLRFDPARAFKLPVWQLEQLRGGARRARQQILQRQSYTHAVWLLITCFHLELIIDLSLIGIAFLLLPPDYEGLLLDEFLSDDAAQWFEVGTYFTSFVALSIIEPLYVAAAFSLYINRRTLLEGWDIELVFRRMARRLQQLGVHAAAVVAIGTALATLVPTPALAESARPRAEATPAQRLDPSQSKQVIKRVLEQAEFQDWKETTFWTFKSQGDESSTEATDSLTMMARLAEALARLLEALLWGLLAYGVIVLVVYWRRWTRVFTKRRQRQGDYAPPEVVMGMDIRPESLPKDIAGEAERLWRAGEQRAALSLLYRGSLMALVNHERLALEASHTEGDVLCLVRRHLTAEKARYQTRLTHVWQGIAYAHRSPEDQQALALCRQWPQHFEPLA